MSGATKCAAILHKLLKNAEQQNSDRNEGFPEARRCGVSEILGGSLPKKIAGEH